MQLRVSPGERTAQTLPLFNAAQVEMHSVRRPKIQTHIETHKHIHTLKYEQMLRLCKNANANSHLVEECEDEHASFMP